MWEVGFIQKFVDVVVGSTPNTNLDSPLQLAQVCDLLGWNDEVNLLPSDNGFIVPNKNTHDKTSSPQRKLGSRPSH